MIRLCALLVCALLALVAFGGCGGVIAGAVGKPVKVEIGCVACPTPTPTPAPTPTPEGE